MPWRHILRSSGISFFLTVQAGEGQTQMRTSLLKLVIFIYALGIDNYTPL
jgi:hypothetical protein